MNDFSTNLNIWTWRKNFKNILQQQWLVVTLLHVELKVSGRNCLSIMGKETIFQLVRKHNHKFKVDKEKEVIKLCWKPIINYIFYLYSLLIPYIYLCLCIYMSRNQLCSQDCKINACTKHLLSDHDQHLNLDWIFSYFIDCVSWFTQKSKKKLQNWITTK